MEGKIKTGSVVGFRECLDPGDKEARFLVTDDYGEDCERCELQALNTNLPLPPTSVRLKSDLYVVTTAEKMIEAKLPDEEFLQKIGKQIQSLRKQQKLNQKDFAEKAHLDRSYLARIESGKCNLTLLSLKQIAEALHIEIGEIV